MLRHVDGNSTRHREPAAGNAEGLASAEVAHLDKWFVKRTGPISLRERVIGLIVPTMIAGAIALLIYWGGGGFSHYMSLLVGWIGSLMVGILIQRPKP
jgi:hypothetical protein